MLFIASWQVQSRLFKNISYLYTFFCRSKKNSWCKHSQNTTIADDLSYKSEWRNHLKQVNNTYKKNVYKNNTQSTYSTALCILKVDLIFVDGSDVKSFLCLSLRNDVYYKNTRLSCSLLFFLFWDTFRFLLLSFTFFFS